MKKGKVYLVGAGPGDPGLLTVKGLECLKQADVILYDRLFDVSLLEQARPDVEKIYVGKSAGWHTLEQEKINELLVKKAREGRIVVRLKGGDPFVFGRGGEELEALAQSHIPFEVVPGISSAMAVPAYAGIPLTHRNLAASFIVVTGHEAGGKDESAIAWDRLGASAGTLVILMGMANLGHITKRLLDSGMPQSTPVALIADGTTSRQRVLVGRLEDITTQVEKAGFKPPAIILVGKVVNLREKLAWFEGRPLFGKRILVTRPIRQAGDLSRLLLERGAVPVEAPVIKIQPLADFGEFDREVLNLKSYHWIIFTSVNGVEAFFARIGILGLDARWLNGISIGAIGPGTARALEKNGVRADFVPDKYTSRGLVAGLKHQGISGKQVLLPRADMAGKALAEGLASLGAKVREVIAYRTILGDTGRRKLEQMLEDGQIDVITFASASAVKSFLSMMDKKKEMVSKVSIACIGPETEAALKKAGLKAGIVAQVHTMTGLVAAIEEYFGGVLDG